MPDNVSRPLEGQAFVEFDLKLPTLTLPYSNHLTIPDVHHITETAFGYGRAEISFRVTSSQFLDKIMKAMDSNGSPIIRWRMGLGRSDSVQWTPWQIYYVFQYSSMFEGIGPNAGHYIKISARDSLQLIDRASKTKAHRGTISNIIKRLASDNGITDTVIEDTQGEGVWIQSFEGDFEFARSRLIARARSKRGRGNYYLFMRDNVLHFHTVEHQTTIVDFDYFHSAATKLEAIDLAQAKIDDGSAGVRVVYHDPYTGESKEVNSDPAKAIRMANSIPRLDKIAGAQRNICEHRIQIRDEEAGSTAVAQNAYESARSESFQLKMQTSKTFFLRPGSLIRLNIDPSADTTSSWSGVYLVATASHIIDKGELNSVYVFQRGEQRVARSNSNALASYGVNTLQDEQNAPGYDLNLKEAQSSPLTKGAGKLASGGAYLTVTDKSKLPVVKQPQ